jgi:hypothetical protein
MKSEIIHSLIGNEVFLYTEEDRSIITLCSSYEENIGRYDTDMTLLVSDHPMNMRLTNAVNRGW